MILRILELQPLRGIAIPNVEVGLRASPPMRRYTFTDDTGHFVFRNPPNQPYGLEAGKQHWTINQVGTGLVAPYPSSDFFEFVTPSAVFVTGKDGQPMEGERVAFTGIGIDGKPYPPPGQAFRRFRYSTSVVELRGENLSPGKVAKR